jgi:predicted glycosyltransferase
VRKLPEDLPLRVQLFTGPFMAEEDVERLCQRRDRRIFIDRFTADLPAWLQMADLSISMAGYNTCMAILATGVRALTYPFAQNREQGLRAGLLAERGLLEIIEDQDLAPSRLAERLLECLSSSPWDRTCSVDIDGAANTARWTTSMLTNVGGGS